MTALQHHLRELESAGLVTLAQTRPELEYAFRHALVQEAAYASLLREDRRALHLAVAQELERLYPDRLDELAPVLGRHFQAAGEDARAVDFLERAGDLASIRYANAEAAMQYGLAIESAGRIRLDSARLTSLYLRQGRAFELSGHQHAALGAYQKLQRVAQERGDPRMELAGMTARLLLYSGPSGTVNESEALALADRSLAQARELGDRASEARVHWCLMLLNRMRGFVRESIRNGEQALAIARELGLTEQAAYVANDMTASYMILGEMNKGVEVSQQARALWEQLGNLHMLSDSYGSEAYAQYFLGQHDDAIRAAEQAEEISLRIGNAWGRAYARIVLGPIYRDRGELGRAVELMEEGTRFGVEAGFLGVLFNMGHDLAQAYLFLGLPDRARTIVDRGAAEAGNFPELWRAWLRTAQSLVELSAGDLQSAAVTLDACKAAFERVDAAQSFGLIYTAVCEVELATALGDAARAAEIAERFERRLEEVRVPVVIPDLRRAHARALRQLGQLEEARNVLQGARGVAESLGLKRPLWEIQLDLSEIEDLDGNVAAAASLRAEAREIVAFIADHTWPDDLRTAFLAQPRVRTALGGDTRLRA